MPDIEKMKRQTNALYEVLDLVEFRLDQVEVCDNPLVSLRVIASLADTMIRDATTLYNTALAQSVTLADTQKE